MTHTNLLKKSCTNEFPNAKCHENKNAEGKKTVTKVEGAQSVRGEYLNNNHNNNQYTRYFLVEMAKIKAKKNKIKKKRTERYNNIHNVTPFCV